MVVQSNGCLVPRISFFRPLSPTFSNRHFHRNYFYFSNSAIENRNPAAMAALVELSSHPQKPKLRPPPGSQNVASIARSGSIAVASGCSHPMTMKSKVPRLIVESLQRRYRQLDFAQQNKVDGVKSRRKKNSKLRSIFSVVFIRDGRRRSLREPSPSSSFPSAGSDIPQRLRKDDSISTGGDDEERGKSSFSSTLCTAKKEDNEVKKTKQYFHVGTKSTIVSSLNHGSRKLSMGNSFHGFRSRARGESRSKKAADEKEEGEEITNELCKKKILMGGKCKPLNSSGKLHYDEEGILVPEPLPP